MKKLIAIFTVLIGISATTALADVSTYELDYNKMSFLDAENLAEQGIKEAYEELIPKLAKYVSRPAIVEEIANKDLPNYKVSSRGHIYEIYSPELKEDNGQSWGRATNVFFQIVNSQLKEKRVKFYALYNGNDLGGIFLTQEQYYLAIKTLSRKTDWPYLPELQYPWYGQSH